MAQAKKRSKAKIGSSGNSSTQGLGMLLIGIFIGSMGTILWQGMQSNDDGVGSGIRKMIEQSRQQEELGRSGNEVADGQQPIKQQTNFDFFTVLPEIEVVVPAGSPEEPAVTPEKTKVTADGEQQVEVTDASSYMLQAGSYQRQADADRLKAELALLGMSSVIQKVTIQDRGDFYRVRLGPYGSHAKMVSADQNLAKHGIKTLRLKISKGG